MRKKTQSAKLKKLRAQVKQLKKERTYLKTFQAGLDRKINYHTKQQSRANTKMEQLNMRIDKLFDSIENL